MKKCDDDSNSNDNSNSNSNDNDDSNSSNDDDDSNNSNTCSMTHYPVCKTALSGSGNCFLLLCLN